MADAAADAGAGLAEGQFHAFDVAAFSGRAADEAAEGEIFAGGDGDAVEGGDREFEVDDFVVLQRKVGIAEFADQFGGVFEVAIRQAFSRRGRPCVAFARAVPGDVAEQSFLPHAQPVQRRVVEGKWFHPWRTAQAVVFLDPNRAAHLNRN